MAGEIKPGWQLPQNQSYCAHSYYLVSDSEVIEIRSDETLTTNFRSYSNLLANITGIAQKDDNQSCGDFIQIENIGVTGINPEPFDVEGVISCVPNIDSEGGCIKSLQVGNVDLYILGDNIDLNKFEVEDHIKVTGIVSNGFINPPDFSGVIQAFKIEKIEQED